jgi:hypothetical protein
MAKFVVSNVELIKKDYVVDAYTKEAAQEKAHLQPPRTKVSLGEITHSVTNINEYEYKKEWKSLDPDIGPDQLKDIPFDGEDYISYGGTNGDS